MNPEFNSALLVLAYLALGMIGIALLMSWTLKRFGWPEQPSSEMPAPQSKEQGWRKASASIPRLDHENSVSEKTPTAFATLK